ncbi:MAG: hypothetical protein K2U26_19015 [Cyclobacteriaceae bacterium]|nr:hypothetical protein [Cyclobacteriaceae bacterium]
MKFIILIYLFAFITCSGQKAIVKIDTLLIKDKSTLSIDNGFAIPPFEVSGVFCLRRDLLTFHPKPFRRKRYEMHNDLIKDIELRYSDIITVSRRGIFGLKIQTEMKTFKLNAKNMNLRTTIAMIKKLRQEQIQD